MDDRLDLVTLPLDTPDDDPRWKGWKAQIDLGFLEPGGEPDVPRLRDDARAEGWRLRGVIDPDALIPDTPVATFTSVDKPINVGDGRQVPGNLITDVTVRASHRRRGILRHMMTRDLTEARERGCVLAMLTASEGGIYGRFGFGLTTRCAKITIAAERFQLRRPTTGRCDLILPADLGPHYDRLVERTLETTRGASGDWPFHRAMALGEWSWKTHGPNARLYAVVHRDDAGEIDGLATYEPIEDSDPGTIDVKRMLATSADAELALWSFLVNLDLVERVTCGQFRIDDPLQAALVDPRAIKVTSIYDMMWVRVLDAERALAERAWDADGDLVLGITDPLGFIDGSYALQIRDGRATVTRTDAAPQATIDAETLGQLYMGGVAPAALADAGRIDGDADAVVRLFTVLRTPWTPAGF